MGMAYLLVGVHTGEASLVTALASLLGDVGDLLLGAVGEVAGVGVVCHGEGEELLR